MNWAGLLQNVLVMVHLRQLVCGGVLFSVPEEQGAGVLVGSIGAHFPPPYQLLTQRYLRMNDSSGAIYTTEERIDREALWPQETPARECLLPQSAVVGPSEELIQFKVLVEDINDNAPHFENNEIYLSISEEVAVGSSFLLDDLAMDRDAGPNGVIRYHLEGSGGVFSVAVEEGPAIVLVVRRAVDRETQDRYRMSLVATDHGSDPLSATATVIVNVTDANDNCPEFDSDSPRRATVAGGSIRGTVVARVRATDPDLGSNAAITYSLSLKVSERARRTFNLDSLTGNISLAQDLHSDSYEELVLKVLASGPHCPPADTLVTVSLLPTASQEPSINIRFIAEHQNQTIMLPENQPPTVLALLEPRGDSSFEGTVLSIEGEVPFTLSLQNGKYLLSTSKPMDYELRREYDVSVSALGPTAAAGYVSSVIRVLVVDVNDNAPQFLQSEYQLDVEENNKPGASLLRVGASDADSWQNGRVTYRLGKPTATIFKIDRVTGQLSVSVPLDREKQDMHTLTVLARDNGSPPLESSVTVSVRVLDQNDNAPVFLTPHFIFFIPENIPTLAQVGKIGVTDADEGPNGDVELRVLSGGGPFVVDNAQGTLRCTASVDREMEDRYELSLLATDRGRLSPRTSIARVTVFVEDVNDNQPKVILPSSNMSCLTISPATAAGTMVTKIYATDEDSGLNSEITYTVAARQPPQSRSPFRLDARSGNITLAQRLLGKDLGMHHLFIVVSDGGKPSPLHTTVWVNLLVNETVEPCHLETLPRSLPYRLTPTPSETPACVNEEGPAWSAELILLVGLGMMAASVLLFLGTVVLYVKQRKISQQHSRKGKIEETVIPLRLKRNCYSEE
ncbi:protocadherin-20 [Aplochiton taeniatus]